MPCLDPNGKTRNGPMSITLELPQELASELSTEAGRLGLSLSDYVLRLLSVTKGESKAPKTGADVVAFWQNEGLIGYRSDITDSQKHARQLRAQAENRERQ
jgi:hypothetical protein